MTLHSNLTLEYHEKQPSRVLTISSIAKDLGHVVIEVCIPPLAHVPPTCDT